MQVYRREAHGAAAFREQQVDAQPLLVRGTLRTYYGSAPGSKYLRENESRFDYHAETLISALGIVMKNTIINVYKKKK